MSVSQNKKAYMKKYNNRDYVKQKKVAFSVSDVFCIERFRESFRKLVEDDADIVFANEEEAKALFEVDNLNAAIDQMKSLGKIFAITRGELGGHGAVFCGDEIVEYLGAGGGADPACVVQVLRKNADSIKIGRAHV